MDVNKLGSVEMEKVSADENIIYEISKRAKEGDSVVINLKAITPAKISANVEVAEKMTKKKAD